MVFGENFSTRGHFFFTMEKSWRSRRTRVRARTLRTASRSNASIFRPHRSRRCGRRTSARPAAAAGATREASAPPISDGPPNPGSSPGEVCAAGEEARVGAGAGVQGRTELCMPFATRQSARSLRVPRPVELPAALPAGAVKLKARMAELKKQLFAPELEAGVFALPVAKKRRFEAAQLLDKSYLVREMAIEKAPLRQLLVPHLPNGQKRAASGSGGDGGGVTTIRLSSSVAMWRDQSDVQGDKFLMTTTEKGAKQCAALGYRRVHFELYHLVDVFEEPAAARARVPVRVSKAPLRIGTMHHDGGAAFVAMVEKELKDANGATCDALYRLSDRDCADAWQGLDSAKNLQSKFSAALCVYWALMHDGGGGAATNITWNTLMPEGRSLMEAEKARRQVEGSAKRSSYDVVRAYVTAKVERKAPASAMV
jgi:hypothetical protein